MQVRLEVQLNAVAGDVPALIAVTRPILTGTLYALKHEVVREAGGYDNITLRMLARLYRPGDGDCGLCFEYAVHDALNRGDALVTERIDSALRLHCHIGGTPASILFGAEKDGSQQLIDTAAQLLTDESALLYGTRGRPLKLKRHLTLVAAAFKRPDARRALPHSISGLWKADLFLGAHNVDKWVGTSVKINARDLEPARGLRVGVVPSIQGGTDAIRVDDARNLVVVPLPYDGGFMQVFFEAWGVVQQFISADAHVPKPVALPRPADRQVARELEDRRDFPVLEVVEALAPLGQPELLQTTSREANVQTSTQITTGAVVAPVALRV